MITHHVQFAPFTSEAIASRTPYVRGHEIRWTYPLSKYANGIAEYLDLCDDEDEATGDANEWTGYFRRFGKRILVTTPQGFVYVTRYDDEGDAIREFEEIDREFCEDTSEDEDEGANPITQAEWWIQENIGGRSTGDVRELARTVLAGIHEGDPAVTDSLEGADEDTIARACADLLASSALDGLRDLSAFALARLADCASPDTNLSAGADFLRYVRDSLVDRLVESVRLDEDEASDLAHEIADQSVPIYTHQLWCTFVDLAGYDEDTSGFLGEGATADSIANAALYQIGERLALALWGQYDEDMGA